MRLGCCGSIDQAAQVKAAGFDFLEVNVQQVLKGDEPGSVWDASAPDPDKLPLPIEAANSLVPVHHPIVGPQRNLTALQDYMQRVAKRAERLGIRRLVFGSGGARKRPDGFDHEAANQQLAEFLRMAGDVCAHHDVILVIEHLNARETNTINKLDQARALCDRVACRAVALLVDSYHFALEHERDEALVALGDRLRHVHVAEPVERIQPGGHGSPADNPKAFDFEHFFSLLHKIGYDEGISFEGKWSRPLAEAGSDCVRLLRQAWTQSARCDC